jgi:hypothetical protein
MMLQIVASPTIVILTTLEAPILNIPENIYNTSDTYNHPNIFIVQATEAWGYSTMVGSGV